MIESKAEAGRLRSRLPMYAAIIGIVIFVLIGVSNPDTLFFWDLFVVAPILLISSLILIVLLIRAAIGHNRRQLLPILATLIILWAVPGFLFFYDVEHPGALRETARWLIWSHGYKAEVLSQKTSAIGDLKHIEWDGWGFPGAGDTMVFLVFDPTDSLSTAAKSQQPGKFNGIPCKVALVRRLESFWYAVLFYTDETWNQCG
jgi:hypothetical protein